MKGYNEILERNTEHGICKQMNGGKDDGVGESEAPSAHPREAKAWTGYAFPQRTDERSIRSFIGLCVMRLPFAQNFFFVLFLFGKEKGHLINVPFKNLPFYDRKK